MNIIKHIDSQWSNWESHSPLFFISKEAMVCAVMTHLEILNEMKYINVDPRNAYLSFFKKEGACAVGLEDRVTIELGAEIIANARLLVKENLSDDKVLF
jgi:hypothetical protein